MRCSQFVLAAALLITHLDRCMGAAFDVGTDAFNWRAIGPSGTTLGSNITLVGLSWEAANPGWNSSLLFDDTASAGWSNASSVHLDPMNIWLGLGDGSSPSPVYFRREFTLGGSPTAGILDVNVDDDTLVWINGTLVHSDSNGLATVVTGIDVGAYLTSGDNLIAIKGYNRQGAAGLISTLHVRFTPVPEPSSVVLAAFGGCALLLYGRSKLPR